jgi:hypothetical protein
LIDAKSAALDETLSLKFHFRDKNFLKKNSEGFGINGRIPFRG